MSLEDSLYPLIKLYEAAPQPLKSLAGRAYRAIPASMRYGPEYSRFQTEAAEVESWDETAICDYQVRQLRASLLAAARSPFYAETFAKKGVRPEDFESITQLADYPYLTKSDLVASRDEMLNPAAPASQRLLVTTGGSTGVPVGFYLQKGVSRPKEQAYLEAQWMRRGYVVGDRVAVVRGAVTSHRSDGGISYYDATRNWLILSSYHLTPARLPEYVRLLNEFRPQHLHAYPSAALMLAKGLNEMNLRLEFELKSVLCGSEKLSAESQSFLQQAFGARVFHWYGHSERVVLAGQGRQSDHLYFWPTYGFVEFGEPNEEGMREVIGTSFHNQVMPLIRYRTGDFVMLPTVPERELPMMEIEAVAGREYEFLISASGRRISLTAMNMHDDLFDGLMAVQFFQDHLGKVEFRYQPGPSWRGESIGAMRDGLLKKLGDDFVLDLTEVREIEKTPTGKHRWLVSELSEKKL